MKNLHPISDRAPSERTHALWASLRWFIETIWSLFGGPESIAAMHHLARGEHGLLSSWLRKAEALARRLLLIEAAEIEIEEQKYKKRAARRRDKTVREFFADEPHLWRVSFCMCEGVCEGTRAFSPAKRYVSLAAFPEAWPLAERFEALLRVFDAPELYIQRAARLLRRALDKIAVLTCVPLHEGFEEVFERLRPLLARVLERFRPRDTS